MLQAHADANVFIHLAIRGKIKTNVERQKWAHLAIITIIVMMIITVSDSNASDSEQLKRFHLEC